MNNQNDDFFDKVISKNKYTFVSYFLNQNKNIVLDLLEQRASYKNIFLTLKEQSNLNLEYRHFCRQISKFKMTYLYQNLNNQTNKSHEKILAAKILKNDTPENKIAESIFNTVKQTENKQHTNSGNKKTALERMKELRGNATLKEKKDTFTWKPSIKE